MIFWVFFSCWVPCGLLVDELFLINSLSYSRLMPMLWTSCGLIVDFLPYYIKTKKETKKNSLKGSLKKTSVMFCQRSGRFSNYAGNFCQLCWKFPEVSSIVWAWYAFCSGMVISRNKFFACLQILHHIQHGGLRRMLYLCNPFTQYKFFICILTKKYGTWVIRFFSDY